MKTFVTIVGRRLFSSFSTTSTIKGTECILEKLPNGISVITLNRPKQRNALGILLLDEFVQHLNELRDDGYDPSLETW